jgi:glycosidase
MPAFGEGPEVEDFFFGNAPGQPGVAQRWLNFGAAGWRTDVTPWLSDNFWRNFRRAVRKTYPEAYLVAEDWGDASRRLLGDMFDATMNYRFANAVLGFAGGKLGPLELDDRLETLRRDTPPVAFQAQLNMLDSHDTPRALTVLGGDRQRLMLAVALQFAYPGVPMVYSGDEAGQPGAYAEDSRRAFPWDALDEQLGAFYRRVIHTRRGSRALSKGEVETAWIDSRGGYAILRRYEDERILAVFNNSSRSIRAEIPLDGSTSGHSPDLLGALPDAAIHNDILTVNLPALSAGWYRM